jgi:large subunit ribosomal protein L9
MRRKALYPSLCPKNPFLKGLEKMKILLIKDVYKLGRAGDVKRVADGFGRNFLIPQGFAVLATEGALRQVDKIRTQAADKRAVLNNEMGSIANQISALTLAFAAKAGETGKLYGSITAQEIADAIKAKIGFEAKRQQIDMQPIRVLGDHKAHVRLTMDLIPEVKIVVYREGEADPTAPAKSAAVVKPAAVAPEAPAPETPAPVAVETSEA